MDKQRKAHYLTASTGAPMPKRLAIFAVAAEPSQGSKHGNEMILRAWYGIEIVQWHPDIEGQYIARSESAGNDKESWHEWLKALLVDRARLDVWSCFTSAACAQLGMWEELEHGRWKLIERYSRVVKDGKLKRPWTGTAVVGDPPFILVVRPHRGKGTVRLLDVRNLGVDSWQDVTDGNNAKPLPYWNWWQTETPASYIAQECAHHVRRYLCEWIRTIKDQCLGSLRPTVASQSWGAFRYRFLAEPILCHCNRKAESLETDVYFPGRAEAFHIGKVPGPIYQLDINSCYPAIVMQQPLPVRFVKHIEDDTADVAYYFRQGFDVIAECLISTEEPVFPYRRKGATIFPIGNFATTLAGPELRRALALGCLQGVVRASVYETSRVLQSITHWALQLRAAAKLSRQRVKEDVAKRMINSLYGRFAQRIRQWITLAEERSETPYWDRYERNNETGALDHFRSIAWMIQQEVDKGLSNDAIAAIPATICSAARIQLYDLSEQAGFRNVCYMATDSLLVNMEGKEGLRGQMEEYPGEPGKLKLASSHAHVDIYGVGHVESPETNKAAGVPKIATGSHADGFKWDSYERPQGALSRGKRPGALLVPRSATYKGGYRHGRLLPSGEVIPFELREFE